VRSSGLGVPAVFLDRDGVLNEAFLRDSKPLSPTSSDELNILPGVVEACDRLHEAGFTLVVVTNQPDIARGLVEQATVASIHDALLQQVHLDHFYVCPHDDADGCPCRKPAPGMLLDAARRHSIDLSRSYLVGDRWRDIEAGRRAGCRTILIDYGYDEQAAEGADTVAASLVQATAWIRSEEEAGREAHLA
jgi:D-glycero-D-manno-heptose 1,7-bisphosphate phosphatase